MLRRILDAHGGGLPDDVHVIFANTGKERTETLDFVRECAERWNVRIRWIEWRLLRTDVVAESTAPRWLRAIDGDAGAVAFPFVRHKWTETCAEVDYERASRKGEPFEALIRWKQYLPNMVQRICTQHLKIEAMKAFIVDTLKLDEWDAYIGIRYDEPRRWRIIGKDKRNPRETKFAPLVQAKVTESDVLSFWKAQTFDLKLKSHEGNCDLCFMKGQQKLDRILRANPELAAWWIEQESNRYGKRAGGGKFRADRPGYLKMLTTAQSQTLLPGFNESDGGIDCNCTD